MMRISLYFCLLSFLFSCYLEETLRASKIEFETLEMSFHLSSTSVCSRASTNGSKNGASSSSRLEVVHRYGPCAVGGGEEALTLAEILAKDQLRVQSIQARTNKQLHKSHDLNYKNNARDKQTQLPVRTGDSLGIIGEYIVTIGLGTPKKILSLIFDTGSDMMWTQCQPCIQHCYRQREAIFKPSASKTYSNILCKSHECSELRANRCYHNSKCVYGVRYGDGSYTTGFYSRDTLTVTPNHDVFPDFRFGCGQNNSEGFGQTDGLLGLGRGPTSFVSQTEQKYSRVFSYCLPPNTSSTGFLTFGKHNNKKKNTVITPLVPPPRPINYTSTFYYIEITAISIGGTRLRIKESMFKTEKGTIIDSGTKFTYLPPAAYKVMSTEFKRQMTMAFGYKIAPAFDDLVDTCFHIIPHTKTINVPTVSFTFKGNATINLDPSGILWVVNSNLACLAFIGSTDVSIFGSTQQMKFQVTYDVVGKKLGFRPNPNCNY